MKKVHSSSVQCLGPRCKRRPVIVVELQHEVEVRGIKISMIFACSGHKDLAVKRGRGIEAEYGVGFSESSYPQQSRESYHGSCAEKR